MAVERVADVGQHQRLQAEGLLPAIYFIFSRQGCDTAVGQLMHSGLRLTTAAERRELEAIAAAHVEGLSPDDLQALDYDTFLRATHAITRHADDVAAAFRRMVFNVVARNQDDHVKNIAFLMNKSGEWRLSPAFDMTYSFNPAGAWTARHQMTMNGKRDDFTMEDFNACAKTASMKRGRAAKIVAEVQATVSKWRSFAEQAGVPDDVREKIQGVLNLKPYKGQ
mgnify:CR=1 FL=1